MFNLILIVFHFQFFSETAHNPETNRRPKQYQPAVALTPKDIGTSAVKPTLSTASGAATQQQLTLSSQQQGAQLLPASPRDFMYGSRTKEGYSNGNAGNR